MVDPGLWRGRSVFVTGHTGFKGSWLSLWLQRLGARVAGLALAPNTDPALFKEACVAEGMLSIIGDIRDLELVKHGVTSARPEVIFHLAAQPLVRESYRTPVDTLAVNVVGTAHVLEAARACPTVRAVVVVTSDKCYENREWPWGYREIDPMGGADPYSASKGCTELVTAAYRRSFFGASTPSHHPALVATARAGNVVGGGDWAEDRLIPDIVRAVRAARPVEIRNPGAVRPWQHVLEPLSGYLVLAEQLLQGKAEAASGWNFGPFETDAWSVFEVAERFVAAWPGAPRPVRSEGRHPHEAHSLRLDWSKARDELGWIPRWRVDTILENTARWYRRHAAGDDARMLALEQLDEYCTIS